MQAQFPLHSSLTPDKQPSSNSPEYHTSLPSPVSSHPPSPVSSHPPSPVSSHPPSPVSSHPPSPVSSHPPSPGPSHPPSPVPSHSPSPVSSHPPSPVPHSSQSPIHKTPSHSSHSQLSNAAPNNPTYTAPLHSLFTTEDSDDPNNSSRENSESEEREDKKDGVTFKSFRKAHSKKKVAKKKLEFDDNDVADKLKARPKRVDPKAIHSETQRMIRESKIRIPEYVPPTISLQEVLKKLPKLTSPPVKPDTLPSPLPSNHVTSTPLPKSCFPTAPSQLADLPEIEFLPDEPAQGLEQTQEQILSRLDTLKLRSISSSLPTPRLAPLDITHLDLTPDTETPVSTLESFKKRFITQSIGPVRKQTAGTDEAQEEDSDSLLPSAALSKLANKPGAAHALLHDNLRRSLMAKRAQEHRDLQLRLRYENEELLPSEESCDVPGGGGGGTVEERGSPVSVSVQGEASSSDSSSCSSSSESEGSSSEAGSGAESEGEGSSDSEDILAPNLKAKRQVLNEDSDSEGSLLGGDSVAQLELSCELEYSQPRIPSPSQSIGTQLSDQVWDENEAPLIQQNLPCEIDYHCSDAVLDSFMVSPQFQLPHSQASVPDGIFELCDPLTQEGESQLPIICTGRFPTQVTQAVEREFAPLPLPEAPDMTLPLPEAPDMTLSLDDTMDADMPVLAPRKMRAKDKLRLKRYRRLAEFEEREAELSGSDQGLEGSEYGSEFGEELDEYECEEGDLDGVEGEEVERINAKYYNKIMIEDDEANLELLKDRFLPEQDIVEDGLRLKNGLFRKRKFNFDDGFESSGDREWGEEAREDDTDQVVTQERRRRRVEREDYIAKKSVSTLSELKYGDTRTLPLAEKSQLLRVSSCDPSSLSTALPSIRKSLVNHNSLLLRSLSANTKLNPNLNSESNSDSNLVGRKAFVFQTTRSLEAKESSSSAPSITNPASVPPSVPSSSSLTRQGQRLDKTKMKSEFTKDISFSKPTSFFNLLNAN